MDRAEVKQIQDNIKKMIADNQRVISDVKKTVQKYQPLMDEKFKTLEELFNKYFKKLPPSAQHLLASKIKEGAPFLEKGPASTDCDIGQKESPINNIKRSSGRKKLFI